MDAHLMRATFLIAISGTAVAWAGTLNDPTLPPAAVSTEPTASENIAAPSAAAPLRLQMIMRGPGELRTAFIDGKPVRVGDTLSLQGESVRVLRISDSALVLQRADQSTETLELAPDAAKAVTRSKTSSSSLSKTTQCAPGKPLSPATACNNALPVESAR